MEDVIGTISGAGRRNLARNLFKGFYERGLGANDALNELRDLGLGYRRTDFLADYRQEKSSYDQETAIRYVSPSLAPTERILEPKYFGVPDKYSMVFQYGYTDPETGESGEGYFFYHRNSLNTRADMENDAYDWLSSQSDRYPLDIHDVRIVEGYINPVWA